MRRNRREESPDEPRPTGVDAEYGEAEAELAAEAGAARDDGESQDELSRIIAERDEYLDRWKRISADFQNARRRSLADSEERVRRAMHPFLAKMLTVLDYLDMALASPATHPESKNLAVGVRLTRDHFVQALEQEDVRPIPETRMFDPALHEAAGKVEREDLPPGTIVEVQRPGYTWRGDVLRHAQVIVAAPPGTGDETELSDWDDAGPEGP